MNEKQYTRLRERLDHYFIIPECKMYYENVNSLEEAVRLEIMYDFKGKLIYGDLSTTSTPSLLELAQEVVDYENRNLYSNIIRELWERV